MIHVSLRKKVGVLSRKKVVFYHAKKLVFHHAKELAFYHTKVGVLSHKKLVLYHAHVLLIWSGRTKQRKQHVEKNSFYCRNKQRETIARTTYLIGTSDSLYEWVVSTEPRLGAVISTTLPLLQATSKVLFGCKRKVSKA